MRYARRTNRRRGLSLLEVLVALAVFLFSYVAIWQADEHGRRSAPSSCPRQQ